MKKEINNKHSFVIFDQEQYETIYLALNEEFKASIDSKSIPAFKKFMKNFFEEDSLNHVTFQKEFKVDTYDILNIEVF